jgi:hypothetical protein
MALFQNIDHWGTGGIIPDSNVPIHLDHWFITDPPPPAMQVSPETSIEHSDYKAQLGQIRSIYHQVGHPQAGQWCGCGPSVKVNIVNSEI